MAVMGSHFRDGILIVRVESNLTAHDAEVIMSELGQRALQSGAPIVMLIDLGRASRIVPAAQIAFADAARSRRMSTMIFVAKHETMAQSVRTIAAMSERGRIHCFASMNEARLFAQVCAHNARYASA